MAEPGSTPAPPSRPGVRRRQLPGSQVLWGAVALVALQLAARGWVALTGNFFADDLILTGRAGMMPVLSAEYLLHDHDGQLMPGGFLVAGALTHWWPLQWWAPVVSLLLLQAIASVSVLRLLRVLLGDRPVLLVPLLLYLFSPLTLPAFAWWAAALNALPLQAGLAWVAADAVVLARTGKKRYAVTGTIAFALSLAFFAKAVLIPWFALVVVVLLGRNASQATPVRWAVRRGAALWTGAAVVTAVWVRAYLTLVESPLRNSPLSAAEAAAPVGNGIARGVLPALLGGPWSWYSSQGSPPWAGTPLVLAAAGCAIWLGVVVATVRGRRDAWIVWLLVLVHVAASAGLMVLGRLTPALADNLPLTLRHFSDCAVVVAVAVALILRAPSRSRQAVQPLLTPRGRRLVLPAAAVLFVVSSLWSTVTFQRSWTHPPAEAYLQTARSSLAAAGSVPLLDQTVAADVLWGPAYPDNLASQIFAPLPERPPFAPVTSELRLIVDSGELVPAHVVPTQLFTTGPLPDCGHIVSDQQVTVIPLEGPLFEWGWTVQLDFYANRGGIMQVSLAGGEAVRTEVHRGLQRLFVRLTGGGRELRVQTTSADVFVCVPSGIVGLVEADGPTG